MSDRTQKIYVWLACSGIAAGEDTGQTYIVTVADLFHKRCVEVGLCKGKMV